MSAILEENLRTKLVGHQFHHEGPLALGDRVEFVREPQNTFDRNAVAVYSNGYKVGYVKSRMGPAIFMACLLDNGVAMSGFLEELFVGGEQGWMRVEMTCDTNLFADAKLYLDSCRERFSY
jgi:hypothetical protein